MKGMQGREKSLTTQAPKACIPLKNQGMQGLQGMQAIKKLSTCYKTEVCYPVIIPMIKSLIILLQKISLRLTGVKLPFMVGDLFFVVSH